MPEEKVQSSREGVTGGTLHWTREELVYQLTIAAELEHGLACLYMFAAFSLKTDEGEGLAPEHVPTVQRWKKAILGVAVEEMLHLSQVSNLLSAIGWTPHMRRPNFPQPADAYPFAIPLSLVPFCRDTLERFVRFELPEAKGDREPVANIGPHDGIEPFAPAFTTIGALYAQIRAGFERLAERDLFIGRPRAQTLGARIHFEKGLIEVCDRASALAAVDMIVEQGEAATGEHPDAHFRVFQTMLEEFDVLAAESAFSPARAVNVDPVARQRLGAEAGNVIRNPATHAVAELANFAYETLVLILLRFFSHLDESDADQEILSHAALRLMTCVISPLGETLAQLPFGGDGHGTAGMSFGLSREIQLLPTRDSAFSLIAERLQHLAEHTNRISVVDLSLVGKECAALSTGFRRMHRA